MTSEAKSKKVDNARKLCGFVNLIYAQSSINLVMMPMWLLSGTFFSSERFPAFLQPFIKVLPLTALNDALRAVMNEGTTLADNVTLLCVLLAWAVLSFIIALKVFRWQ